MRRFEKFKNKIMNDMCRSLNIFGVPFIRAEYSSMQTGSPSLVILQAPPNYPEYCGAAVVVLHPRRKLTVRQHHWWNLCSDIGLRLAIVFDVEDGNAKLEKWGYFNGQEKRKGIGATPERGKVPGTASARLGIYAVEDT